MASCNICHAELGSPLYLSSGDISVTSLCELHNGKTEVFFCQQCAHLQTSEMPDVEKYYDQAYTILIKDEEEDQIYKVEGDDKTYRIDHQVSTLQKLVDIPENAEILDYGCAKSSTMRKLVMQRPDITPFLYDVSEMYIPFWERFSKPANWRTYTVPEEWFGKFQLVTSFFALEHVTKPRDMLRDIHKLLQPGGIFYGIVPDTYINIADFVVLDHVNHFSHLSASYLLSDSGFDSIKIDACSHDGAIIIVAHKSSETMPVVRPDEEKIHALFQDATRIADYWNTIKSKIRQFETNIGDAKCAIYGSGFYGTFITTCLEHPERISCYIDQSPWRQGERLMDRPIVSPAELDKDIGYIYVGLRPEIARANIDDIPEFKDKGLDYFYL